MVVDLAQFRSGRDPVHGLLTVLEEIPGYMHSADLTSHLIEHGYWASYNNPYFDDISTLSGNADMCTENSLTCYSTDPRANLFRKHQSSVRTLGDMQRLMGLNEFASDPLSLNDSCNVSYNFCYSLLFITVFCTSNLKLISLVFYTILLCVRFFYTTFQFLWVILIRVLVAFLHSLIFFFSIFLSNLSFFLFIFLFLFPVVASS